VQAIFNALRPQQVQLLKEIAAKPVIDDSFLHIPYDEQGQWDFGIDVITRFGYDFNRGRQDKAVHPFTTSFGIDDVRITTRFDPDRAASALFSTMHEAGHAMYEQGVSKTLRRTLLANGASMAVHESQSRMWENLVGRSRAFWQFFYPRLVKQFPQQLANVTQEQFYRGINKVEPSLIRVEADEATYNLHIMLRFEIEEALINGRVQAADLPGFWNAKMKEYLGVEPPDDAHGVMQDVHWAGGMFGYFPSYMLGNLYAAQFFEAAREAIPKLDEELAAGHLSVLREWQRSNIHACGALYDPKDLLVKVTGKPLDYHPFMDQVRAKYGRI